MQSVTSHDGIDIVLHTLHAGPSDHRPVVFAHATGFHGLVWGPVAAHVDAPAYSWDARGHGASVTPTDHDFDWRDFGADALAVVEHLNLETRPIGVGHSMGATSLVMAELARPGTFAALMLYEPIIIAPGFAAPDEQGNQLAIGARRRRQSFASRAAALDHYRTRAPLSGLDPACLAAYVEHGFVEQPDGTVSLACRPHDEAEVFDASLRHDTFARLGRLRCPTTVAISGDNGGAALFGGSVAAAIGGASVMVFGSLTHFGPLEDPARFAAVITDLLGETALRQKHRSVTGPA
jgi:pimeloyl-ACP methyl ester carboxylesterase